MGDQQVTGTKSNVAASATSVTVLAANSYRQRYQIWNDSAAVMYLDETGGTASATSCTVPIAAGAYYESPTQDCTPSKLTALWASATGTARVTEWQ